VITGAAAGCGSGKGASGSTWAMAPDPMIDNPNANQNRILPP